MSRAWITLEGVGGTTLREVIEANREAALRAVELDPDLSSAHVAMANLAEFEHDLPRAEDEVRKAIDLEPNSAVAHLEYCTMLRYRRRSFEAVSQCERAATLDPLSPFVRGVTGAFLCLLRRYDLAAPRLRRSIELDPQNPGAYNLLAETYEMTRNLSEALRLEQEAERLGGISLAPEVGRQMALLGRRKQALQVLEKVTKPGVVTSIANARI